MPLQIIRSDITKVSADAIVNSTNPVPSRSGHGGADFHIYEAAGRDELQQAREKIGHLDVADIAVTEAFHLSAKFIIHTVGPRWNDGRSGELFALENCYARALEKAKELDCSSIAFSLISSGSYHFPKDLALKIAIKTIGKFLQTNEMEVTLVVFDKKAFEISAELDHDIQTFIDENYVQKKKDALRQFREKNIYPKIGEHPEEQPHKPRIFRTGTIRTIQRKKTVFDIDPERFSHRFRRDFPAKTLSANPGKTSRRHFNLQESKSQPPAFFKDPERHPIQAYKENGSCACRRHATFSRRNRGPARPRRIRPFPCQQDRPDSHLLHHSPKIRHLGNQQCSLQIRPTDARHVSFKCCPTIAMPQTTCRTAPKWKSYTMHKKGLSACIAANFQAKKISRSGRRMSRRIIATEKSFVKRTT